VNNKLLDRAEVPTLHSVIRTGDESIIQTTRLDQEIQQGLARLQPHNDDDELELLIDDVVDRHITALRQDIRLLLERALHYR